MVRTYGGFGSFKAQVSVFTFFLLTQMMYAEAGHSRCGLLSSEVVSLETGIRVTDQGKLKGLEAQTQAMIKAAEVRYREEKGVQGAPVPGRELGAFDPARWHFNFKGPDGNDVKETVVAVHPLHNIVVTVRTERINGKTSKRLMFRYVLNSEAIYVRSGESRLRRNEPIIRLDTSYTDGVETGYVTLVRESFYPPSAENFLKGTVPLNELDLGSHFVNDPLSPNNLELVWPLFDRVKVFVGTASNDLVIQAPELAVRITAPVQPQRVNRDSLRRNAQHNPQRPISVEFMESDLMKWRSLALGTLGALPKRVVLSELANSILTGFGRALNRVVPTDGSGGYGSQGTLQEIMIQEPVVKGEGVVDRREREISPDEVNEAAKLLGVRPEETVRLQEVPGTIGLLHPNSPRTVRSLRDQYRDWANELGFPDVRELIQPLVILMRLVHAGVVSDKKPSIVVSFGDEKFRISISTGGAHIPSFFPGILYTQEDFIILERVKIRDSNRVFRVGDPLKIADMAVKALATYGYCADPLLDGQTILTPPVSPYPSPVEVTLSAPFECDLAKIAEVFAGVRRRN